ncbi:expressed protein [Phakopsora pachyrhizi]|uniref:Expressed protein n=1 Tax=Phakopsora pachyrhizi TaxID=170000 RepID=A0AAV0B2W3_PHAPC|nr:expressed protein [Phakopsora pachyrhizi]
MFSKSRLTSDDYENGREHRNHMSGSRDSPTYVHQVQTQTAQPVRLPQIQLPHPERDLYHTVRQPISTNPSLHHYKSGDSGGHSTQTLLREFFSRPDDCTSPPIVSSVLICGLKTQTCQVFRVLSRKVNCAYGIIFVIDREMAIAETLRTLYQILVIFLAKEVLKALVMQETLQGMKQWITLQGSISNREIMQMLYLLV